MNDKIEIGDLVRVNEQRLIQAPPSFIHRLDVEELVGIVVCERQEGVREVFCNGRRRVFFVKDLILIAKRNGGT